MVHDNAEIEKMAKNDVQFTEVIVRRKSKQAQVNLSHATVLGLLDLAGASRPTKDAPLALGSPAKGKAHLIWDCITSKGEAFQIVQGDTHGLWLSHQDGVGRDKFEALLSRLGVGQSAKFRVVAVRHVPAGEAPEASEDVQEVE